MLLLRSCNTRRLVAVRNKHWLSSAYWLPGTSGNGFVLSAALWTRIDGRSNALSVHYQSHRPLAAKVTQKDAEKRLNELLQDIKERQVTSSKQEGKQANDGAVEATSIDDLYDRFTPKEDRITTAIEEKSNNDAVLKNPKKAKTKSVFDRLAKAVRQTTATPSLFDSLTSEAASSKSAQSARQSGRVAATTSTSLFDRLITAQTSKASKTVAKSHQVQGSSSKPKPPLPVAVSMSTRRADPSTHSKVVDTVLTALSGGPALAVFTAASNETGTQPKAASSTPTSAAVSEAVAVGEEDRTAVVKRLATVPRRGAASVPLYANEVLNKIEHELRERALNVLPFSAFEEQIAMTRVGRLWPYPIDNEHHLEEAKVHFREHVFVDRYLNRLGFPNSGPLRRYAELVCLALSNNAQLTARQKRAHLEWLRYYFADRLHVLDRYARDEDEKPAAASDEAQKLAAIAQSRINEAHTRSDALGSLLSRAERAATRPDAVQRGAAEMRTEKRQRKDIIQATRTAEKVLHKADAPTPAGGSTAPAGGKKADAKKK